MTKNYFISLVIPTYNKKKELLTLLTSIKNSSFKHFSRLEVVIVDDCSEEKLDNDFKQKIKSFPFTIEIYRLKKNSGPAYTRNWGVKHAKGKYVIFLDADVVLGKKTLARAWDFFDKKEGLAFTGIWDFNQAGKKFFPQYKALRDAGYWFVEREQGARYYLFSTRIAGIEKKLFTELKGFNTNYPKPTVEDIEFTYRIEQKTPIHFVPEIVVRHEFEDFSIVAKKYYLRARDWIKLYIKRLRFDPVATSKKEAKKSIFIGLSTIFLALFVLTSDIYFFVFSSFCVFVYFWYDRHFLKFLYDKKGLLFTLQSIPYAIVLYLIIDLGSTVGLVEYFAGRNGRK